MRQAKLSPAAAASAALEGDVLRAVTCTNIVWAGGDVPQRSIVVYGADGQTWPAVVAALKKGLVADGPVTLVLERRLQAGAADSGSAVSSSSAGS